MSFFLEWISLKKKSENLPLLFKNVNFSLFPNSGNMLTFLESDFTPRNLECNEKAVYVEYIFYILL